MPSPVPAAALVFAALLLSSSHAFAVEGGSSAEAALRRAGIVLLAPEGPGDGPFDEALIEALHAGLTALPPSLRDFPGGPLELRLRRERSTHGMGEGTRAKPEWEHGRRRFLLYAYAEPSADDDARARYRLEKLDGAERERLWRSRALVHAVVQRWDDARGWSRKKAFRRLSGWRTGTRVSNTWSWAFSRARGMESASLDLVTFAEEALVPVESIRADALAPDDRVACQELSKSRFLGEVLRDLEGSPPEDPSPLRSQRCPAFEAWSDVEAFSHHEVLFTAPSGGRPQSLFGHLMLRPVFHRTGGVVPSGRSHEPVYEVAAITGHGDGPLSFVWKGLFGGYQNVYEQTSLSAVRAEQVAGEQRTVRRFPLRLTPEENVRLLERLWELERRGYFAYWFLTDNCATYVARAVEGALDESRWMPWLIPPVLPAAVLDTFASMGLLGGEPATPILAGRERALEAEGMQAQAVEAIAARDERWGRSWRRFLEQSRHPEPLRRSAAHARLPALVSRTLAADASLKEAVHGAVAATVQMERYAAERAEVSLRELEQRRVDWGEVPLPSAEELVALRQRDGQRESGPALLHARISRLLTWAKLYESAPRRQLTAPEQRAEREAVATRRVFLQLASLWGDLRETHLGATRSEPHATTAYDDAGVARSGRAPLSIGVGTRTDGQNEGTVFAWSSAFLRERFGERRAHGMDRRIELRLIDTEVHWGLRFPIPQLLRVDMYVVALWTLPREPELTRRGLGVLPDPSRGVGPFGTWGWGFEYRLLRRESAIDAVHQLRGGALAELWGSAASPNHLLLYAGPELRGWSDLRPQGLAAGGFARTTMRLGLPGGGIDGVRLSAGWSPAYALWRPGVPGWSHEVELDLAVQVMPRRTTGLVLGLDAGGWFEVEADARRTRRAGGVRAMVKVR